MPLVTFDYNDFIRLLGHKIPKETLIEKLPMIGGDFSHANGDEINIECDIVGKYIERFIGQKEEDKKFATA